MGWHDTRVVFQDIDGCLNTPGTPLPDGPGRRVEGEQAAMLRDIGRAIDASRVGEVVLNTGRGLSALDFVIEELACRKLRYVLAEHGSVAFDIQRDQAIDLQEIAHRSDSPERAMRYGQLSPIRDAIAWYDAQGEAQLSALFERPLPALPKDANLTLMVPQGVDPRAMIAALEQALAAEEAIDASDFVYHYSDHYVDIISEVSKGDGALLLLAELGPSPEQTLAMGDGQNDISMFEVLGSGFCPANAAPELKQLCLSRSGIVSDLHCGEAALEFYRRLS